MAAACLNFQAHWKLPYNDPVGSTPHMMCANVELDLELDLQLELGLELDLELELGLEQKMLIFLRFFLLFH